MENKDFTHLHLHDQFSTLDALGTAEQYVEEAKRLGFTSLALTNHANVDGVMKWQKACLAKDIVPLIGCEGYIVQDAAMKVKGEKRSHITLLVKNKVGWVNLLQLISKTNISGYYYRPRMDLEMMLPHLEGLVVMTACAASFIRQPWGEEALVKINEKTDTFLELMPHNLAEQHEVNALCLKYHERYNIPLVATNDCHYIKEEDSELQEVLLAMQSKKKWKDPTRWKFNVTGLFLRSVEQMYSALTDPTIDIPWSDAVDAVMNTQDVFKLCRDFRIEEVEVELPDPPMPDRLKDLSESEQFIELTAEGLEWRKTQHSYIGENEKAYFERLEEELALIIELKFERYFLIVWELIAWCKKPTDGGPPIMCGPGRGSVGGCLIAYCLGITQVDPLIWDLVFSRFISAGRVDLPDIDMDFEDRYRDRIRWHLEDVYGKWNVTGLTTFGKMKGRGALRDVGRVFDLPYVDVDKAAKAIVVRSGGDMRASFSIEDAFATFEDGKRFMKKYPKETKIAMALEGQVKSFGKHAAAMCVSKYDLRSGRNGAYANRRGELICNWDKHDGEPNGLMKLDVLGLNALTILAECRKLVLERHGVDIDYDTIPLDDKEVYKELTKGNNIGLFQLGSHGMMKLCREIEVNEFEDIVAMNALHRPGCLRSGMVPEYRMRKHGIKKVEYIHPIIKEITKGTYGLILYQEQIMALLYNLGGLKWKTTDMIRKVISKSQGVEQFQKFEQLFVDGCINRGTLGEKEARDVFRELKHFGSYGFNKAHSVEYSLIGYWEMWLKQHYPQEFMISLLSWTSSDEKKYDFINECRRMGMKILLPDVNLSNTSEWALDNNGNMLIPFLEIKGVGEKAAEALVLNRNRFGPFKDMADLESRIPPKKVNKTVKRMLGEVLAFSASEIKLALTEDELDALGDHFAFELSNDPMHRYRKLVEKVKPYLDWRFIREVDFLNDTAKTMNHYFGRMEQLRFGYRKAGSDMGKEIKGVQSDLGGVYGNFADDTDFVMLVFSGQVYKAEKERIEHCEGDWLLVEANHPWKTTSLHTSNIWFGEDLLQGKTSGLNLQMAEAPVYPENFLTEGEGWDNLSFCDECALRKECSEPVHPSQGEYNIAIIGEAPGKDEDRIGDGFVGRSGDQLWSRITATTGLDRSAFHITNVCKCWPSDTRTPKPQHIKRCSKWLDLELKTVKPYLILAFGNTSNQFFRGEKAGIMTLNAETTWSDEYNCWICWSIHPAMTLYQSENKALLDDAIDNFAEKVAAIGFGV